MRADAYLEPPYCQGGIFPLLDRAPIARWVLAYQWGIGSQNHLAVSPCLPLHVGMVPCDLQEAKPVLPAKKSIQIKYKLNTIINKHDKQETPTSITAFHHHASGIELQGVFCLG
jgi:hypothetical protein